MCSHVVFRGLYVRLSWYPCGCGDCYACNVVCVGDRGGVVGMSAGYEYVVQVLGLT